VLFTWVDEVSRSSTYLAASKPDHNAGGPDFAIDCAELVSTA
jgi:hypothetical protein